MDIDSALLARDLGAGLATIGVAGAGVAWAAAPARVPRTPG